MSDFFDHRICRVLIRDDGTVHILCVGGNSQDAPDVDDKDVAHPDQQDHQGEKPRIYLGQVHTLVLPLQGEAARFPVNSWLHCIGLDYRDA